MSDEQETNTRPVYCPACGKANSRSARYCLYCGTQLVLPEAAPAAATLAVSGVAGAAEWATFDTMPEWNLMPPYSVKRSKR